jgi:DNA-binding MarR family transcriptional regulator
MATQAPKRKTPADDADALNEQAVRVLRRFRLVFNTVKAHFREVEKKAGVAGAQLWALSVISTHPGVGVGALARAMDIHQSTASNLLRPLLENGMVRTERSGTDRRAVHLHITPAGLKVLRRAPGPFTGVLPQALASLDNRTLARLERDLGRLIEAIGTDDESSARVPLGQPDR